MVNIATLLSEQADLRSWNMLPANIQFAYMQPQDGEVSINGQKVVIDKDSKNLLLINSLSHDIFHYQE